MYYAERSIVWCSIKQSQYTNGAEYVAAVQCCKQMKYIKSLFEEILSRKINVNLHLDNQSCIKMVKANQLTNVFTLM